MGVALNFRAVIIMYIIRHMIFLAFERIFKELILVMCVKIDLRKQAPVFSIYNLLALKLCTC